MAQPNSVFPGPRRVRVAGDLFHGAVPPGAVYVGRQAPGLPASPYANPHRVGDCALCRVRHDNDGAAAAYARHLTERPDLVAAACRELAGKDVACWCRPGAACHGDVLLAVVNDTGLAAARALSVRQPWAELILRGVKSVENRTWTTPWRGLLIVHAGQRWDPAGAATAAARGVSVDPTAPRGYLGVAVLVDVHPDTGCCRPWGEPGAFHWLLVRPRRFTTAVAGAGRLGLYRLPTQVCVQEVSQP